MKKILSVIMILTLLLLNCGCQSVLDKELSNTELSNEQASESSDSITNDTGSSTESVDSITWDEITENGVNEDLLVKNINQENLEKVATNLQSLCEIIAERERASNEYVLSAKWLQDYPVSKEYKSVIGMGASAMKPLYFIIYKSENQGLYEYLCASALQELSNEKYEMWGTSKEFLDRFNERIIENRK